MPLLIGDVGVAGECCDSEMQGAHDAVPAIHLLTSGKRNEWAPRSEACRLARYPSSSVPSAIAAHAGRGDDPGTVPGRSGSAPPDDMEDVAVQRVDASPEMNVLPAMPAVPSRQSAQGKMEARLTYQYKITDADTALPSQGSRRHYRGTSCRLERPCHLRAMATLRSVMMHEAD